MKLKVKKLDDKAILPKRMHSTDAGMDLTAIKITTELSEDSRLVLVYHTGLSVEIPEGYMGLLFPRSSIYKKSLALTNCVGVVDSGYRGEVLCKFVTITNAVPAIYREGERFAQLIIMPIPEVEIEEVTELNDSERGENGYGSTENVTDSNESVTENEVANEMTADNA